MLAIFGANGFAGAAEEEGIIEFPRKDLAGKAPCAVIELLDGDILVISHDGRERAVSLAGVDLPDAESLDVRTRSFGREAARYLEHLLTGEKVFAEFPEGQPEGNPEEPVPAFLFRAPDGLFVNLELVRLGYGFVEGGFGAAPDAPADAAAYGTVFNRFEKLAKESRRGMWGMPDPDATMRMIAEDRLRKAREDAAGGIRPDAMSDGTFKRAMRRWVSLSPPYPEAFASEPRDEIRVLDAAACLLDQAGIPFNRAQSATDLGDRAQTAVRPDLKKQTCRDALVELLSEHGLAYSLVDGSALLRDMTPEERLELKVTLTRPYALGDDEKVSLQMAMKEIASQVGLEYDRDASERHIGTRGRTFIRPDLRGTRCGEAIEELIKPFGLRYELRDAKIVLLRQAQTALQDVVSYRPPFDFGSGPANRITITQAVHLVLNQVGVTYDAAESEKRLGPAATRYAKPILEPKPCHAALAEILGPAGFTFEVVDNRVVVRRR
ncbi:MAG TPA: thermonuclease family protein [Candidatus Brocadiia bacterium]|nr:thermonuclease family protein [Candidatus Brocadiia bacterium]